jgi:hypothetical protein
VLDGFEVFDVRVGGTTIHGRRAGSGPPLLLAVLDVVPTAEAFARADARFALGYWVWSFLAAGEPVPERLIAGDPGAFVDHLLDAWSPHPLAFPPAIRAEYVRPFTDPATVHAICEEYRAAATLDVEHNEADRGRRRIKCPLLVLWSADGPLPRCYADPPRPLASHARSRGLTRRTRKVTHRRPGGPRRSGAPRAGRAAAGYVPAAARSLRVRLAWVARGRRVRRGVRRG